MSSPPGGSLPAGGRHTQSPPPPADNKAATTATALAPQPGAPSHKQPDSGDAALVFFLSVGKFFGSIFRMSVLGYCFWVGLLYVVGATLMIVGFRNLSPNIGSVPACPAKQNGYLFVGLWYFLGVLNILTAYGYLAIESMGVHDFHELTSYMQAVGFLTKIIPTYSRLIHVFSFCQLDVIAIQLLFLPECNGSSLIIVFGITFFIWWGIVVLGVWSKQKIFVPPFLYSPIRPSRTFFQEIEKMMRSFGP